MTKFFSKFSSPESSTLEINFAYSLARLLIY